MEKSNATTKKFQEICLAGACNRGVCYLGSIKRLEEENLLDLKKFACVSIGAFIGACYIIGYTTEEMLEIIVDKDTKDFQDITLTGAQGAILKGEEYRKWVHDIISAKIDPNITLMDLYKKTEIDFIMTATCIYASGDDFKEGINYFSYKHTPDMPLIVAVYSSMSFPFIFPPIVYESNGGVYHFVDGGVMDNFPLDQVGNKALGLRVNFTPIDGLKSTNSPISYIGKLFELIARRMKILVPGSTEDIVVIMCDDFSLIDFEMSIDDKLTLYKRGYTAIDKYLSSKVPPEEPEEPEVIQTGDEN